MHKDDVLLSMMYSYPCHTTPRYPFSAWRDHEKKPSKRQKLKQELFVMVATRTKIHANISRSKCKKAPKIA